MAKHQHYVPRKYLRAWAPEEKIWCLQDRRVFCPNVMGVAQERYFYKMERLDASDFTFVHSVAIEPLNNQLLRAACEDLLDHYRRLFALEGLIPDSGSHHFDEFLRNVEDEVITGLEQMLFPYLDRAIAGDLRFMGQYESAMHFCHGLMLQYFRTHRIRANLLSDMSPGNAARASRVWPLFRALYSLITSVSIVHREPRFSTALLSCPPESSFITSDQPVINIDAVEIEYAQMPETVQFYYPVSPSRALLLSESGESEYQVQPNLTIEQVDFLNRSMMKSSHRQVYANNKEVLSALL